MAKLESINSDRIVWCCKDRGITLHELAQAIKMPLARFEQVLAEQAGLTFNQLRKIANLFNRTTLFFLEPGGVTDEKLHSPQFRTIANQKATISPRVKALIERVERQRDVYLALQETLDDSDTPKFKPPKIASKNLRDAAAITREWLNLSEANDFATYRRAVEAKGVLVFRSNGYNGAWQIPKEEPICGFTVYTPSCPVIMVKKMAVEGRQVFTLMHELAHILLHRESFIDEADDLYSHQGREREANEFAGLLLVTDDVLRNVDDRARPDHVSQFDAWVRIVTRQLGISPEVVLLRLLDVGRLDRADYDSYREWRSKQRIPADASGNRMYRHREPRHVFGDPFVGAVLDSLNAKHITLTKASTYLDNLKITDLHKLESFYAGL